MNNEEKIISILETLVVKVDKLEQGQAKLEQRQAKLESEMVELKAEVQSTKEHVILIENEHGKKIGALFDGQDVLLGYIKKMNEDIARIKERGELRDLRIIRLESDRKTS
jgi:adenosyl cobinamide kinase/adenosyl cobinamide phosphate guanylyltransferase